MVVGEHVPDRLRQAASEVDLGDFGPALLPEAGLRPLVAGGVGGVVAGMSGRLDQGPAQVAGTLLGERAAPVAFPGLVDTGQRPV